MRHPHDHAIRQDSQVRIDAFEFAQQFKALQRILERIGDAPRRNHAAQTQRLNRDDRHVRPTRPLEQPRRNCLDITRSVQVIQDFQRRRTHLESRRPSQLMRIIERWRSRVARQEQNVFHAFRVYRVLARTDQSRTCPRSVSMSRNAGVEMLISISHRPKPRGSCVGQTIGDNHTCPNCPKLKPRAVRSSPIC